MVTHRRAGGRDTLSLAASLAQAQPAARAGSWPPCRPTRRRAAAKHWGQHSQPITRELGRLPSNPVDRIQWTAPAVAAKTATENAT